MRGTWQPLVRAEKAERLGGDLLLRQTLRLCRRPASHRHVLKPSRVIGRFLTTGGGEPLRLHGPKSLLGQNHRKDP